MKNDIRVDKAFPAHRKTRRLIKLLGPGAPFSIIALWCYAGEYRRDGSLAGMSHLDIAEAALYDGNHDKFIDVLLSDAKFLDKDESGNIVIHEWATHQPYIAHEDIRREKASILARIGWLKRRNLWDEQNPDHCALLQSLMQDACKTDAVRNAQRMQDALRKACAMYKHVIVASDCRYVYCESVCAFFSSDAPYPSPSPYPSPIPIYTPEKFSVDPAPAETAKARKPINKRVDPPIDYERAIPAALEAFGALKIGVENYISAMALKNKHRKIAQSRTYSIIMELTGLKAFADNYEIFRDALRATTEKEAENLNYMKAVIESKKAQQKGGDGNGSESNRLPAIPGKYSGIGQKVDTGTPRLI